MRAAKRIELLPRIGIAGLCCLLAALWAGLLTAAETVDIRGPDITIIDDEELTVFEYRQGGVLRMVRVVPNWGKPYDLVPRDQTAGHEDLERADALLPSWVIVEF